MSVVASIRKQLAPIHPEGYLFIALFALAALALGWLWSPLGWIGWLLTAWCIYFFRDPPRVTAMREGLVISPADGRVDMVGYFIPPPELELGEKPLPRVTIFMSVFDCHVNRAPVAGKITKVAYKPGLFLSADLDKASEDNERNGIVIDTAAGRFGIVQIAGLLARRIVSFDNAREGAAIQAGERFGLIRFGSRVDVYMPEDAKPLVGVGQTSLAGETILADLSSKEAQRTFKVG
ncbi:MAG: phosphatidylserine decarboxylase [Methylocystis sp.]|nr:phosphatidylserine decarboxylase [Methylocystis sp.]MCA3582590.1 phosphatidylserine decarboxylase [Methylocystis sp.]MCA3586887.1 phosphatidylserine decarboxylase [Methylocystis sp.]MCA3591737.1 phosphatidylserine decarboxylase [Methylocystis sp.]